MEGRSNRRYTDEAAVAQAVIDTGRDPYERKLLGITALEKLLGKKLPVVEGHPFPMENFELPKKDKNGRPVNAEDAEARAAAREKHRERDEARQAAAREKRLAEQTRQEEAAYFIVRIGSCT